MIAVLRSEVYRTLALRSGWVSIAVSIFLGVLFGWFDTAFWSLFAGLGAFGLAVVTTAQHYQHRTAVLLFLGQPRRLRILAAQCVGAAGFAVVIAVVSGLPVLSDDDADRFLSTLLVVPLMAVFGVANATVVRHPLWLFSGYAGWVVFIEALIGKLEGPLPFAAYLAAATGDHLFLLIFAGWTTAAVLAAVLSIRRDLSGD
jgi:ABC-2 type transport system ATP-binding protein